VAIEATVTEDFTAFTRMKKGQEPQGHEFKKGAKVSLSQIWKGELCLIKNEEGKVFNIKKTFLEKDVFDQKVDDDKGKTRRKRANDIPDYADLSAMRPDLAMERGLAPHLTKAVEQSLLSGFRKFLGSRSGATLTVVVLVLAIFLGWRNIQKSRNRTPFGLLAAAVIERGALQEPGHFEPSYHQLRLNFDGSKSEAKVHDSPWGRRTLTLKMLGKKTAILASEQEARWLNNKEFRSAYYDEYVDVGSNGKVDQVIQVLEFRSGSNQLVGAYRKTIRPDRAHESRYRQSIRRILKTLLQSG
jgi:hypothetical protein